MLRQWWYITISDRSQKVEDGWDIAEEQLASSDELLNAFRVSAVLVLISGGPRLHSG